MLEEDYDDWEEEEEDVEVKSLFGDMVFTSVNALIAHDKSTFGFDLKEAVGLVGTGDLTLIVLINFLRRKAAEAANAGVAIDASALMALVAKGEFLTDEQYLIPPMQDDALLFLLQDALGLQEEDVEEEGGASSNTSSSSIGGGGGMLIDVEVERMEDMKAEMNKYKALVASLTSSSTEEEAASSGAVADDAYYFDSYAHLGIHETMLRDSPRTSSYANALALNANFVKGKVVLDVGVGSGILCMLAARAGAKKVVGVDCSSIIERTRRVVAQNGFSDVITLVRGRLEDTPLPLEEGEVDIIISEWMGYGLYFENMLSSVIFARDTFLSEQGVLMPSTACVFIEAMTAKGEADRVAWWGSVYGFDMREFADLLTVEAQVQIVDPANVVSDRCCAHSLDIASASDASLDFEVPFALTISRDEDLRAFVLSFDVLFAGPADRGFDNEVTLSTSSQTDPTHWKQTVLWLDPAHCTSVKAGEIVIGTLVYKRSSLNPRDYDISLMWKTSSSNSVEKTQKFVLAA